MLDVGTGSGAIALAIADELPGCAVTATDTSERALAVARANAERLGLAGRVRFLAGTIPEGERFDLVLANLPYVAEPDWPSLQPEVTQWEPREALLAGPDGLDAIRACLDGTPDSPSSRYAATNRSRPAALALEVGRDRPPRSGAARRGRASLRSRSAQISLGSIESCWGEW